MPYIMKINPTKHTKGATFMRRALNMSGSKVVSVEPGPVISRKPMMIIAIPIPRRMKLVLSNANLFLSIFLIMLLFSIKFTDFHAQIFIDRYVSA